jgi:hypothetical protein
VKRARPALSRINVNTTNPTMINPVLQKLNSNLVGNTPVHSTPKRSNNNLTPSSSKLNVFQDFASDAENFQQK